MLDLVIGNKILSKKNENVVGICQRFIRQCLKSLSVKPVTFAPVLSVLLVSWSIDIWSQTIPRALFQNYDVLFRHISA